MTFGDNLRSLRKSRGLTQSELAHMVGVSRTAIGMYETGTRTPEFLTMARLSDIFDCSIDSLSGRPSTYIAADAFPCAGSLPVADNIIPLPDFKSVPLLGTIACGEPILADENLEGYVETPGSISCSFALRCRGDSMINARIYDGDIVYIRAQDTVSDGEIAAVLIDDEATLKRVRLFPDHIVLEPENPLYRPLVFWEDDIHNIRILGKAVAFTSAIR